MGVAAFRCSRYSSIGVPSLCGTWSHEVSQVLCLTSMLKDVARGSSQILNPRRHHCGQVFGVTPRRLARDRFDARVVQTRWQMTMTIPQASKLRRFLVAESSVPTPLRSVYVSTMETPTKYEGYKTHRSIHFWWSEICCPERAMCQRICWLKIVVAKDIHKTFRLCTPW